MGAQRQDTIGLPRETHVRRARRNNTDKQNEEAAIRISPTAACAVLQTGHVEHYRADIATVSLLSRLYVHQLRCHLASASSTLRRIYSVCPGTDSASAVSHLYSHLVKTQPFQKHSYSLWLAEDEAEAEAGVGAALRLDLRAEVGQKPEVVRKAGPEASVAMVAAVVVLGGVLHQVLLPRPPALPLHSLARAT